MVVGVEVELGVLVGVAVLVRQVLSMQLALKTGTQEFGQTPFTGIAQNGPDSQQSLAPGVCVGVKVGVGVEVALAVNVGVELGVGATQTPESHTVSCTTVQEPQSACSLQLGELTMPHWQQCAWADARP